MHASMKNISIQWKCEFGSFTYNFTKRLINEAHCYCCRVSTGENWEFHELDMKGLSIPVISYSDIVDLFQCIEKSHLYKYSDIPGSSSELISETGCQFVLEGSLFGLNGFREKCALA